MAKAKGGAGRAETTQGKTASGLPREWLATGIDEDGQVRQQGAYFISPEGEIYDVRKIMAGKDRIHSEAGYKIVEAMGWPPKPPLWSDDETYALSQLAEHGWGDVRIYKREADWLNPYVVLRMPQGPNQVIRPVQRVLERLGELGYKNVYNSSIGLVTKWMLVEGAPVWDGYSSELMNVRNWRDLTGEVYNG